MRQRLLRYLAVIAVFAAATMPFARSARFGLINLDDYAYAENDALVVQGLSADTVGRAFKDVSQHIWMPITWLSYAFDHEIASRFLPDPPVEGRDCTKPLPVHRLMHAHSVVLHGVNAVLLLALLVHLFRERVPFGVCAAAALFWALHPLRCESVCWIASRKDLLSMAFLLLALISWCRFVSARGFRRIAYLTALGCLCLGAMAKPSVMTFPALALLLDVFYLRKDLVASLVRSGASANLKRMAVNLAAYLPFLLVAVAVGITAKSFQDFGESIMPGRDPSAGWRLLNALNSIGVYIWHAVVPSGLAVQCVARYPHMPRLWPVAIPIALAVLGYVAVLMRTWWRGVCGDTRFVMSKLDASILPGLVWFLVAVAPMLGIAGLGYHAFADRFTYIPAIGFSFILCGLVAVATGAVRTPKRRCACRALKAMSAAAALVLLGVATWRQTACWRNDGTLFSHTLEVDGPENYAAHFNLGFYAWEFTHDLDACINHYGLAYRQNPDFVAHSGIVPYIMALCEDGHVGEAGALIPVLLAVERADHGEARSSAFYAARGLWFMSSEMGKGARDDLAVLERDTPNSASRHFLAMKVAEHEGNHSAAAEYRQAIRRANARHIPDYLRYRYLCRP